MEENKQLLAAADKEVAREFWGDLSKYYVDVTDFGDVRSRATVEALLHDAGIRPGHRVLDAGCGHLRITTGLLRILPDISIVGADMTLPLLREGRAIYKEALGEPPCLSCGDLLHVPFQDESFDAAVSARVFQYISEPVTALKEIYRTLKPGARFAFSVPNRFNPIKRSRYKGRLHTQFELGQWLTEAGFTDVRMKSICFLPNAIRAGWDSKWRMLEAFSKVPLLGLLGGNAFASGKRPER